MSSPDPAPLSSQPFLRAERLLSHCLEAIREGQRQRRMDRDRLALEIEQLLVPIGAVSTGLARVIEELAQDRQDNRLQRWQGELQQLLLPLDSGTQLLQELLVLLDAPLNAGAEAAAANAGGKQRHEQQLQQLLQLRQRQVMQLQTEVMALQAEVFRLTSGPVDAGAPASGDAAPSQGSTPSLFS